MAKVVLLIHKGRKFRVSEAAYKRSKARYDAAGAVPATEKEILHHTGAEPVKKTKRAKEEKEEAKASE